MSAPKKRKTAAAAATKKAPRWQEVVVPEIVRREARQFLNMVRYVHIQEQVKQLVGFGARKYETQLDIEPFGDYWELRDKGGVLGKVNVRVYFYFKDDSNEVVILWTVNKRIEGAAPKHWMLHLRNRKRMYERGDMKAGKIVYRHE